MSYLGRSVQNCGCLEHRITLGSDTPNERHTVRQTLFGLPGLIFSLCAQALIFGTSIAAAQTLPVVDNATIRLKNSACVPGKCVCAGSFKPETWLQWHGPRPAHLASGVACIVADFDGNGANDYALTGAEGLATVVLMGKAGFERAALLDAGGVIELYGPRSSAGAKGEPASRLPGILVRHVGQNHAVFLWREDRFVRILFPAS